ncbi:MAG: RICIN domain-containing protein [Clostridia bacterium]|nr:RICIN domain-containing protein [Clostridia bacterium]
MADGTTIHQWKFNGNNSQKWIFEHQGDGFYTVKSANSTGAYYQCRSSSSLN